MLKKLLIITMVMVINLSVVGCNNAETVYFVEDSILINDKNCIFKISGVDENNMWGYTLKTEIENRTDKNLMFSIENVFVNGLKCNPFWAKSVCSGEKTESDISFSSGNLEKLGINNVETIEFTLFAYDEDDVTAYRLVEKTLMVKM